MKAARRNLNVRYLWITGWNAALTLVVLPTSYCTAVISEQYRMYIACRDLSVRPCGVQRWNVTLPFVIQSKGHSSAIILKKYRVIITWWMKTLVPFCSHDNIWDLWRFIPQSVICECHIHRFFEVILDPLAPAEIWL
jgi:hypothetical protein